MADDTVTTGAAQGDTAAAGGNGSTDTQPGAAGSGDGTTQQGQGAVIGTQAFAGQGQTDQGTQQTTTDPGKTDQEAQPDAVVPGAAADYAFQAPEGIQVDDAALGKLRDIALAGKMTMGQFAAIVPELVKLDASRAESARQAYARQREAGVQALRTEWGQDFDGNVSLANKAVKTFGTPELGALFDATGIGDHPLLVKTFATIGRALSEDVAFGRAAGDSRDVPRDATGNPQLTFSDMRSD